MSFQAHKASDKQSVLCQQFRGGTDLASCFRAIMERLQSREWFDADAVVISILSLSGCLTTTSKAERAAAGTSARLGAVAMSAHGKPGIMHFRSYLAL